MKIGELRELLIAKKIINHYIFYNEPFEPQELLALKDLIAWINEKEKE